MALATSMIGGLVFSVVATWGLLVVVAIVTMLVRRRQARQLHAEYFEHLRARGTVDPASVFAELEASRTKKAGH